jgi:hypothetical protein
MAETNCLECVRLHDTYNAATIRYMKLWEVRGYVQEPERDRQFFTEMNDAMLAFKFHQESEHSLKVA